MASLRKVTSIGTLWALCSSSASSPSSPKPKPPPPQGNHPHVPQKTGRPDRKSGLSSNLWGFFLLLLPLAPFSNFLFPSILRGLPTPPERPHPTPSFRTEQADFFLPLRSCEEVGLRM